MSNETDKSDLQEDVYQYNKDEKITLNWSDKCKNQSCSPHYLIMKYLLA